MALSRILDFQSIAALAPGAIAARTADISGMPSNRRLARMWIFAELTVTGGAGAVFHEPQEMSNFISQIMGTIGRHQWSITAGRDLYSYQEVARGSIYAGNSRLPAVVGVQTYNLKFPIPCSYILGGPGEIGTRPPTGEFEGGTMNFVFQNPFAAGDVDDITVTNFNLWAEHYGRGEKAEEVTPGIEEVAAWGGFWASRTPPTGTLFKVLDVVPTMVLHKIRDWATMECLANGRTLYTNITPQQMPMLDSDRFDRFPVDPVLGYALGAVEGDVLKILDNIPGGIGGAPEDWTKLFDGRNDRDADSPFNFQADGAFDFASAGSIIVGRRAVQGTTEVRV